MKTPKFWAILKINGTIDLHRDGEGEIATYLAERDAEIEADALVTAAMGEVTCMVFESKKIRVFKPVVESIAMLALEADLIKAGYKIDLRALTSEAKDVPAVQPKPDSALSLTPKAGQLVFELKLDRVEDWDVTVWINDYRLDGAAYSFDGQCLELDQKSVKWVLGGRELEASDLVYVEKSKVALIELGLI